MKVWFLTSKNLQNEVLKLQSFAFLLGAPKIGKMDTSKNVVQEDDLEIKCDVTGYPYPSVTWKKDGQPLTPNKRITLSSADEKYNNAILSINNLEFEDKGEYTCNATNSVNPAGKTATIVIRVKGNHIGKLYLLRSP